MPLYTAPTIGKAFLLSSMLFVGCHFTVTNIKTPVFSENADTIRTTLNKMVSCENINLNGKVTSTDGKINSTLEINITNGKNIPSDQDQMITLGKSIGTEVKKALKDKNEYDTYQVLFITEQVSGGTTQKTWTGKIFKSEEL